MLRGSEPREFQAFSSTKRGLPQHIERPPRPIGVARCNVKGKRPVKGCLRPRSASSMPLGSSKVSRILLNPSIGVVSLSFGGLSLICRFERRRFMRRLEVHVMLKIALKFDEGN
jgi:hypothetical protein